MLAVLFVIWIGIRRVLELAEETVLPLGASPLTPKPSGTFGRPVPKLFAEEELRDRFRAALCAFCIACKACVERSIESCARWAEREVSIDWAVAVVAAVAVCEVVDGADDPWVEAEAEPRVRLIPAGAVVPRTNPRATPPRTGNAKFGRRFIVRKLLTLVAQPWRESPPGTVPLFYLQELLAWRAAHRGKRADQKSCPYNPAHIPATSRA